MKSLGQDPAESMEEELDMILSRASEEYEQSQKQDGPGDCHGGVSSCLVPACKDDRFPVAVEEMELQQIVSESIPSKTQQHTKWCVDTWNQWHAHRNATAPTAAEAPPTLDSMSKGQLNYWLSRFLAEVRRKDGSEYHGETLHSLICGLQRHLCFSKPDIVIDFMSEPEFRQMRNVLDARMKGLKRSGVGITKKQAEIISYDEEEILWQNGHLGESSPQTLLDTMVFLCGLFLP